MELTEKEILEIQNNSFKEGQKHIQPSPDTKKFMEKVDNELTDIKVNMEGQGKDIEYLRDSSKRIEDNSRNIETKLDNFILAIEKKHQDLIKESDEKYATRSRVKRMEWIIYGLLGTAGSWVIIQMLISTFKQ